MSFRRDEKVEEILNRIVQLIQNRKVDNDVRLELTHLFNDLLDYHQWTLDEIEDLKMKIFRNPDFPGDMMGRPADDFFDDYEDYEDYDDDDDNDEA